MAVSTSATTGACGVRGGEAARSSEHARRIDSNVFPGHRGGPLAHAIAAKAVALKLASTEEFRERQVRTVLGAAILAGRLLEEHAARAGIKVVSGGTDVHLVLVDLRGSELTGRAAEDALDEVGITVNRNAVPVDPRPPLVTSGLRIGTAALVGSSPRSIGTRSMS